MAKELKGLEYVVVEVVEQTMGKLHATTPVSPDGQRFMLANTPSDAQLVSRVSAGEPIVGLGALNAAVDGEMAPLAKETGAAFRRDGNGRPFVHANYIKGHLRDAADAVGRTVGFWGLKAFVTSTLFISPYRIYYPQDAATGTDEWPTHFEVYRMGRLSGFRRAEWVESPKLAYSLVILADPRWNEALLKAIYSQGSIMGKGGGRRLDLGKYAFTLGPWQTIAPDAAVELIQRGTVTGVS